ncbi:rhodanese-like domain-containing protein [Pandoraea norimbergensis]|uniref:Sulfurtransferase n=1 Tax=Pandoraea norimbergensis TaxID=93219 RepID=A0ABN4JMH5_9BURK|nr:rhodanese-like domain-containing protein [Pandoraea norimbergensis]ALS62324.1 sulfurtransferase [Pandoraea norimbergensis]
MTSAKAILEQAAQRRAAGQLAYSGAVTPEEALALLQADPAVRLIDVRTRAELDWVGRPQVPDGQYVNVEWVRYPGGVPNEQFLEQLASQAASKDTPLLFLCRSAARSKAAAKVAYEAGYAQSFDILEGFEGDKDSAGHRKHVSGWCFRRLPWLGA